MSAYIDIFLSSACLQLRTYYLFEAPVSESRKHALIKAYSTSLILISKIDVADTNSNFTKYAPYYFSHILWMAAILVMKIVSSSYSRYVDVEGGKGAFNTVLSLMRKCSVEDNDLKGRMGKILAQLWSVHQSDTARREQEPGLTIKSRFGASILHDSLWLWRERFGGQRDSVAPPPPGRPVSASLSPRSAGPPRQGMTLDSNSSPHAPPLAPLGYISPNFSVQPPQDLQGRISNLSYGSNSLPPDYIAYDLDMVQEERDWMCQVGYPSVMSGDLDFYSTTSALGYASQNQMQQ